MIDKMSHMSMNNTYFTADIASSICPLFTFKNNKVIIGTETTSVALSTNWGTEDDDIFGQRSVQNPHATHCAASVVENPFLLESNMARIFLVQILSNALHQQAGIVLILCDIALSDFLKNVLVKDVEAFLNLIKTNENGSESNQDDQDGLVAEALLFGLSGHDLMMMTTMEDEKLVVKKF
jgi:hypothetical protein